MEIRGYFRNSVATLLKILTLLVHILCLEFGSGALKLGIISDGRVELQTKKQMTLVNIGQSFYLRF